MEEADQKNSQYKLPLGEEVNLMEQEARMILPGIQTLFGFQLIAVFNQSFKILLTPSEQYLHLASLLLVVISGILVSAPAAYHRQAHHHISSHFIRLGSRFLTLALIPLTLGTCLDIYIVSWIITSSVVASGIISVLLFCIYLGIWFVFPRKRAKKILQLPVKELKK